PIALQRFDAIFANHPRRGVRSQHERNVGTVNVSVEQADLVPKSGQRYRQVHRQRGFAYASLAGPDGNDGIHSGDRLRPGSLLSGTRRHMGTHGKPSTSGDYGALNLDYT